MSYRTVRKGEQTKQNSIALNDNSRIYKTRVVSLLIRINSTIKLKISIENKTFIYQKKKKKKSMINLEDDQLTT